MKESCAGFRFHVATGRFFRGIEPHVVCFFRFPAKLVGGRGGGGTPIPSADFRTSRGLVWSLLPPAGRWHGISKDVEDRAELATCSRTEMKSSRRKTSQKVLGKQHVCRQHYWKLLGKLLESSNTCADSTIGNFSESSWRAVRVQAAPSSSFSTKMLTCADAAAGRSRTTRHNCSG